MTNWPDAQWFLMDRREDVGGVSGTGVIGYVLAVTGGCLIFWDTGWNTFEWLPDLRTVEDIHGHNGRTILVPLEDGDPRLPTARRRAEIVPDVMEALGDLMAGLLDRRV